VCSTDGQEKKIGISSVLQPQVVFWTEEKTANILEAIQNEAFQEIDLFCVMYFSMVEGAPNRQISLTSRSDAVLNSAVAYLLQENDLQLQRTSSGSVGQMHWVHLDQGNSKGSRKQVAPLLIQFCQEHWPNN